MSTMRSLVTSALRLLNVVQENETPSAADMDIALSAFNGMLDSWSAERLNIFTVNPTYFNLVPNQQSYTLGTGGDWNTPRPMQILSAQVSLNSTFTPASSIGDFFIFEKYETSQNTLDIPLEMLNDAQYAAINVKMTPSTFPTKIYDNGDFPLRKVYVWPVPTEVHPIILWLWAPLSNKSNLDMPLNLPQGYERALKFNLAVELSAEFGKTLPEQIYTIANEAKAVIKRLNSGPQVIMGDIALVQSGTGIYNWITGFSTPN